MFCSIFGMEGYVHYNFFASLSKSLGCVFCCELVAYVCFLQDSAKGYLKLLFLTAQSGDSGSGEAIKRSLHNFT